MFSIFAMSPFHKMTKIPSIRLKNNNKKKKKKKVSHFLSYGVYFWSRKGDNATPMADWGCHCKNWNIKGDFAKNEGG
jgi:hypothetical protein